MKSLEIYHTSQEILCVDHYLFHQDSKKKPCEDSKTLLYFRVTRADNSCLRRIPGCVAQRGMAAPPTNTSPIHVRFTQATSSLHISCHVVLRKNANEGEKR